MRLNGRLGAATLELIMAFVLWGIVSTAVVGTLLRTARAARRVTVRAERRDMLRAAASLSAFELRGSAGGPATLRVSSGGEEIEYRARRWTSVTCGWAAASTAGLRVTLRGSPNLGDRAPLPLRDSALVWIEGYPSEPADGHWRTALVTGVDAGACPDGLAAVAIDIEPWPTALAGGVQPGSPIVGYERAALRVYRAADGDYWLGQATAGPAGWNAVQPVAGPLAGSSGFGLRADGKSIVVGLRSAGGERDSIEVIVGLRADGEGAP